MFLCRGCGERANTMKGMGIPVINSPFQYRNWCFEFDAGIGRHVLPQKLQRCEQQGRCLRTLEGHGSARLRELRSIGLHHQRQMRIDRVVQPERRLQTPLPGRTGEEICASHDIIYLLCGVVHDN